MIVTALLTGFAAVVSAFTSLLPTWNPSDSYTITDWFSGGFIGVTFKQGMAWANGYVPVDQLFIILSLMLTLWLASLTYHAVVWALTKVHLLGGSDT